MPQASEELRAKFPGGDVEAEQVLENGGFVLTRDWCWTPPAGRTTITVREGEAIDYLGDEWDYGGLTRPLSCPCHPEKGSDVNG